METALPSLTFLRARPVSCQHCCMGEFCATDLKSLLKSRTMKVAKGECLFVAGDACRELYAVHRGTFKSLRVDEEGREVICGFGLAGDLLGLEALADGRHSGDAVALEDSEVCVLPCAQLDAAIEREPRVQKELCRMLAVELRDRQALGAVLATQGAERRVGAFLAELSRRVAERGQDGARLRLPMSRPDIASYLALTPETVSRAFTRLEEAGAIEVSARSVTILDAARLGGKLTAVSLVRRAAR